MKFWLFILFIFFCNDIDAQYRNLNSTQELADKINSQYTNDDSKIMAAYTWVTTNIHYSTTNYFAINNSTNPRDIIDVAFRKRSGVCANFSAIFFDLCQKMGFLSRVIEGYKAPAQGLDEDGHSWVAAYVDKRWYLYDPTWDVGKASGLSFYRKSGNEFISTHIPFDPMWQLLDYPIVEGKRSKEYFNYQDSIQAFFAADSLHQFELSVGRISEKGSKNEVTKTQLIKLKSQLEIKRQEEQMMWFDNAVTHINKASNTLNYFISLHNEQFRYTKDQKYLEQLLSPIPKELDSAKVYLEKVDNSKATLIYGTSEAREKIIRIEKKLQEQEAFLKEYFMQ